jgi:hypothetical protein
MLSFGRKILAIGFSLGFITSTYVVAQQRMGIAVGEVAVGANEVALLLHIV